MGIRAYNRAITIINFYLAYKESKDAQLATRVEDLLSRLNYPKAIRAFYKLFID
jgi:hypothetical protein